MERVKAFSASDGKVFLAESQCQQHEIELMAKTAFPDEAVATGVAGWVITNKDVLLPILGKKARKPRTPKADKPAKVKSGKNKESAAS